MEKDIKLVVKEKYGLIAKQSKTQNERSLLPFSNFHIFILAH